MSSPTPPLNPQIQQGPETTHKTRLNENVIPSSENSKFRPITDLWNSGAQSSAGQVAKECLSCDRWAGTTVAGGGLYLLWKSRQAPSRSSALVMVGIGSIMAIGGVYQGWINHYFTEYRGWPPI